MADESDLERTEPASARRLEKAREEGQVPQSKELATFLVVFAGAATLWLLGDWMGAGLMAQVAGGFRFDRTLAFEPAAALVALYTALGDALLRLLALLALLLLAAFAAHWSLSGVVFSSKALGVKFSKLNPLQGLKRVFSVNGLVEMLKAVLKALLIGGFALGVIWHYQASLLALVQGAVRPAVTTFVALVATAALLMAAGLIFLPLLDVPYQLWSYAKRLRMTREEVKRETKEQEGDPQVKAQVRRVQRAMAQRRMMAAVPEASVVVTNPTHVAVALKYVAETMAAPVVVAKGRGELATRIKALAQTHGVRQVEAPALARALYRHGELDTPVPATLYLAVAQVMAYLYQLDDWVRQGGAAPLPLGAIAVPDGLDPGLQ